MKDIESQRNNENLTISDKIIDKIGYKYPLCCLALWLVGITSFAIIISGNAE